MVFMEPKMLNSSAQIKKVESPQTADPEIDDPEANVYNFIETLGLIAIGTILAIRDGFQKH